MTYNILLFVSTLIYALLFARGSGVEKKISISDTFSEVQTSPTQNPAYEIDSASAYQELDPNTRENVPTDAYEQLHCDIQQRPDVEQPVYANLGTSRIHLQRYQ